jgi:2-iminoacetate synthase
LLEKPGCRPGDLAALLSRAASSFLPRMAQTAAACTMHRFGKTMQFYVPLYLSNECESRCVYCGFSRNRSIRRATLAPEAIRDNFEILKSRGFDNILLLTGESRRAFGVDRLAEAVKLAKRYFTFVGIEVYPMSLEEYRRLAGAGCDGLTLYQETYCPETYRRMHLEGEKKNFAGRLDAPERALEAGFRKVNLGVLLGLADPFLDALCLARHLEYLQKRYWRAEFALSFPRIRPENILTRSPVAVSDRELVHLMCALRLVFPDTGFVLSTRESPELRDRLIPLTVTQISAGSSTRPGGYSGETGGGQFAVSDARNLREMMAVVTRQGYDPVLKDWASDFRPVRKEDKNADLLER